MFIYFESFSIQLLTMGTIDRKYNNVETSLSSFCKKKNCNMGKAIRKSSTLLLLNSLLCVIHKDKAMK